MLELKAHPVIEERTPRLVARLSAAAAWLGRKPVLRVFLVGEDPASQIYVGMKQRRGQALGVDVQVIRQAASLQAPGLLALVKEANVDPSVDAVLIQRPLPFPIEADMPSLQEWVSPEKDVDAFHPVHLGRLGQGRPLIMACTPAGIMQLLDHYKIALEGRIACVVGRSPLVGQPLGLALLNRNATLIQCHSRTRELSRMTSLADVLVAAAGVRGLITAAHVKPGAQVIDVGIHRTDSGSIVGDVLVEEVSRVASALTPVPGGVGPLTVHYLFENLATLVEARRRTAG